MLTYWVFLCLVSTQTYLLLLFFSFWLSCMDNEPTWQVLSLFTIDETQSPSWSLVVLLKLVID